MWPAWGPLLAGLGTWRMNFGFSGQISQVWISWRLKSREWVLFFVFVFWVPTASWRQTRSSIFPLHHSRCEAQVSESEKHKHTDKCNLGRQFHITAWRFLNLFKAIIGWVWLLPFSYQWAQTMCIFIHICLLSASTFALLGEDVCGLKCTAVKAGCAFEARGLELWFSSLTMAPGRRVSQWE